jgi:hypothetical protein
MIFSPDSPGKRTYRAFATRECYTLIAVQSCQLLQQGPMGGVIFYHRDE